MFCDFRLCCYHLRELFFADLDVARLITGLELYAGHKIDSANTLIIFDEVQEVPEAVLSFAGNRDFNEVREIQQRILAAYEQDFSKHAPNEVVPRIRML
jgi:hypothetical protein